VSGLPRNQILEGDALDVLTTLPTGSIDMVMTSPPYFRLRDYRVDGQFGLEPTIEEWVDHLRPVLAECARVLVPTGTLWLNLGDTYSTRPAEGAPRKSLLFGPERLSLALIADGWIVRNKIVWAKTNTLPTSVRDRLATKHEVIYLLTRSWRYFFDLDSVRVPHLSRPPKPHAESGPPGRPSWLGPNNYRGAHFATYPVALAERMLRAGCPEKRCSRCLAPWQRPRSRHRRRVPRPTCDCEAPSEPGIVLDPFIGSGSTAVAARRLDRDWLGVELNPDFRRLALERLAATP
jgi:site-specific DNA-methyltransferase (adenine-specific)